MYCGKRKPVRKDGMHDSGFLQRRFELVGIHTNSTQHHNTIAGKTQQKRVNILGDFKFNFTKTAYYSTLAQVLIM